MINLSDVEKDILAAVHFEGVAMTSSEIKDTINSEADSDIPLKDFNDAFLGLKKKGYLVKEDVLPGAKKVNKYLLSDAGKTLVEQVDHSIQKTTLIPKEAETYLPENQEGNDDFQPLSQKSKDQLDGVNEILFKQMNRLCSDDLKPGVLDLEVDKTKALASVAKVVSDNMRIEIEANVLKAKAKQMHGKK